MQRAERPERLRTILRMAGSAGVAQLQGGREEGGGEERKASKAMFGGAIMK